MYIYIYVCVCVRVDFRCSIASKSTPTRSIPPEESRCHSHCVVRLRDDPLRVGPPCLTDCRGQNITNPNNALLKANRPKLPYTLNRPQIWVPFNDPWANLWDKVLGRFNPPPKQPMHTELPVIGPPSQMMDAQRMGTPNSSTKGVSSAYCNPKPR